MRYLFRHILMRDAVYDMQLRSHLRDLHRKAAEAIQEFHASDLPPHYADLAYHYEQAGMGQQAIEYLHKAADYASEMYDVQRAIASYRRALALLPEGTAGAARRILLYEGLGKMLRYQGHYEEARAASQKMLAAAEAIEDKSSQARAWCEFSWTQNIQADNPAALESARQAEAIARRAGAQDELARALTLIGWALYRLGDSEAALSLGEQALEISTALRQTSKMASSLNLLSAAYDALGQYDQAMHLTREALSIYRALDRRQEEGILLNNLGTSVGASGDCRAAVPIFQEALDIAREIGDHNVEMLCLSNLGGMLVRLGNDQAAEANLRQAIHIAETVGIKFPEAYSFLAEACVAQGKIEQALNAAQRALSLALESQEDVGGAWRALGMVAAHLPGPIDVEGNTYDAPACFAESLDLYTEMGAEGERARTLQVWAEYELAHGDRERGQTMQEEARHIFECLGIDS
jgi:tetratricopeptide (TPR) repeat protein